MAMTDDDNEDLTLTEQDDIETEGDDPEDNQGEPSTSS
jgi:hypothetical protein